MRRRWIALLLAVLLLLAGCGGNSAGNRNPTGQETPTQTTAAPGPQQTEAAKGSDPAKSSEPWNPTDHIAGFQYSDVPAYADEAWVAVNGNVPYFDTAAIAPISMEFYSPLDDLGRCGETWACVGQDLMPSEDRGSIGSVKPTGWQTVKYDFVDGKYLYNRCHLIGFQLSGENANTSNLITGTRYLNIEGMLPFENQVADYVQETGNHVAYRSTPIFDGEDLLARGVLMEGWSVEDRGESICFCIFAYNVQPGVALDYATGDSSEARDNGAGSASSVVMHYVLNKNNMKFHLPDCSSVKKMSDKNKVEYEGTREELIAQGYEPCKSCNP